MIKIGFKKVGGNNKTFIIAEAGVNHNGDIDIARKLIDVAVDAGADAVKFQTFNTDKLVTKNAPKADYQNKTTDKKESQYDMLKKLELSKEDHELLIDYCNDKNIQYMSTPFDFDSVDLLEKLGLEIYKIGSGDLTNILLLKYIAKLGKPMIVSTGMADIGEVEEAVNAIQETDNNKLILLHCVSNYPTTYEEVNLKAMDTMKQAFKLPVGYSDHTKGIEVPIAAVAMGAIVIEKHFTLDKNMEGPDHKASLNPEELSIMIKSIRNVEKSFGNGLKKPTKVEKENIKIVRKSLVINKAKKIGQIISKKDIDIKRPGIGIDPKFINIIIGMKLTNNIEADHLLTWEDLKVE